MTLPVYPFENERCIGTVTEVGPSTAKANLPKAALPDGQWLHGHRLGAGEVGEFVLVECGERAVFGRIVKVRLPERERLTVQPELGAGGEAHPVGTIQLLATVSIKDCKVIGGITVYPRLGSKVYSAHPEIVKWLAESSQGGGEVRAPVSIELASLPFARDTIVCFTPERLFGRHCAFLGATGSGKSWSVARVVEQALAHNAKIVLFDAIGEFYTLGDSVDHIHIGAGAPMPEFSREVVVPYYELTEGDLFALFRPGGQTQGPKLRAAMKSLKLAKLVPALATNGVIVKMQKKKENYQKHYETHVAKLESPRADFAMENLAKQLSEECVWPSAGTKDRPDFTKWGGYNEMERSYCVTLVTRIEDMISSADLACVFNPKGKSSVFDELEAFLKDQEKKVLRVSLKYLPFGHDTREVVVNGIGRYLLAQGRAGKFRQRPLVLFLDEAHQFMNKALGDENSRYPLDSFELIAKEGRKFSLNICISTQRPRDIPEGVLSQMGTLIVHRLTNDRDREVVERASGDIDRSAAAFLPTLVPGQAVVIGVDFPMPLTVQVSEPSHKPDSRGPDYQKYWGPQDTRATRQAVAAAQVANRNDEH